MSEQPQQPSQQPKQPTLQDHVNAQKQALVNKAQELVNMSHGVVDSWLHNFMMAEKVKTKRTDQVNFLLGFLNQIANDGLSSLNALGVEVKDPVISNKILECNNELMTAARNILTNVQQQEAAFQQELQEQIKAATQPPAQGPKTEVKVQEA